MEPILRATSTPVVMGPGGSPGRRKQSPRAELLRQHENLARAPHLRPAAVELGNQRLESIAAGGAIQRGLVGEFVTRLMHGGIAHAPEPPRLFCAERLYGVGQMLPLIPLIKRLALGRIGDGGADDEKGCRHGRSPQAWTRGISYQLGNLPPTDL